MCPLCQHEKYYVLPRPGHCALFLPRFHRSALAGTMDYTGLISIKCINCQPHEISFNICESPSGISHVRRSCVICWPGTLIVGLTSQASMQGQVWFYAVVQLFYKAKHMFCYRTKESNIYLLLQGPEFKPHASLIQQLTNSLLPGLHCKNNFFSFNKNLHQHVANHTVEPNRLGKLYRSILHIHVMLWQLALCNPIYCNAPTLIAKLFLILKKHIN